MTYKGNHVCKWAKQDRQSSIHHNLLHTLYNTIVSLTHTIHFSQHGHTNFGIMLPSSWIPHWPSQSTFKSSLIPSCGVLVTLTLLSTMGTAPSSILVKCSEARGPGSIVLNMGSTMSLTILEPAALMLGHSWATMSLRKPGSLLLGMEKYQLCKIERDEVLTGWLALSFCREFLDEVGHGEVVQSSCLDAWVVDNSKPGLSDVQLQKRRVLRAESCTKRRISSDVGSGQLMHASRCTSHDQDDRVAQAGKRFAITSLYCGKNQRDTSLTKCE